MHMAAYLRRRMTKPLHLVIMTALVWSAMSILQISLYQLYNVANRVWRDRPSIYHPSWTTRPSSPMTMTVCSRCNETTTTPSLLYSKTGVPLGKGQTWFRSKRQELLYNECQDHPSDSGILRGVYFHENTKLAYCPVAKAGCTFWKRIFLFLHNETGLRHVTNPFQIPRMFVHYGKRTKTKVISGRIKDGRLFANFTRFIFVRDPYARLWSAYLDKFYLPDFWPSHAQRISSRRANLTREARQCHHDVTFREFLDYVVSSLPQTLNEHWQPVKYRCDPCQFKPDFVGKQETFGADARYILQQIGLDWVLNDIDQDTIVREEMKMLIDYNFALLTRRFFQRCLTRSEVSNRLFKVFQINGYIPMNYSISDVFQNNTSVNTAKFKRYVLELYHSIGPEEKTAMKLQREQSLQGAYSTIPLSLIEQITTMFRTDFLTFGYDMLPPSFNLTA